MATEKDRVAADFLEWYEGNQPDNRIAAAALEKYLAEVLADANLRAVMVTARAKALESVRGKLLRKPYRRPKSQLTDRLGVRIVVYHAREVDAVAALLRTKLKVRERDSSDKREALGLREFGYRSYHLVASLPERVVASPGLSSLRRRTFEVQIRSLLEHAWAEIEHDVVYKSGADWSAEIKRRFAAIAAVLELLEHDFDQLSAATTQLVEQALVSFQRQVDGTVNLDVPCMCALLEIEYPDGRSFRGARAAGNPFPPGVEQRLHLALRGLGIVTVRGFLLALRSPRVRRSIQRYASAEGIPRRPPKVPHLWPPENPPPELS